MAPGKSKGSRAALIVEAAAARAESFNSAVSPGRSTKFYRNCINIGQVCQDLLQLRPPREPTSSVVSEEGCIRFARFPKRQTLDNAYAAYLSIWREAFNEICNISVRSSKNDLVNLDIRKSDLSLLDEGTSYNVQFLIRVFKELSNRNMHLSKLIYDQGTLDADGNIQARQDAAKLDPLLKQDLVDWLRRMENGTGPMDLDDTGAKAAIRTRPGTLIMPVRIFNGFKQCLELIG